MLYRDAFGPTSDRVQQLYGEVLVFSVSHDNDLVLIYGHLAMVEPVFPEGLKYYRYPIVMFSFTVGHGADTRKPYNFIMNVYEKFVPIHLKRIKDAVEQLPRPSEKTGLSCTVSEMPLDESASQQESGETSLQSDGAF